MVADMPEFHYPSRDASGKDAVREKKFSYRFMRKTCEKAPAFALPYIGNFCYRHLG